MLLVRQRMRHADGHMGISISIMDLVDTVDRNYGRNSTTGKQHVDRKQNDGIRFGIVLPLLCADYTEHRPLFWCRYPIILSMITLRFYVYLLYVMSRVIRSMLLSFAACDTFIPITLLNLAFPLNSRIGVVLFVTTLSSY